MKQDAYKRYARVYDLLYEPAAKLLRRAGATVYPPRPGISILDIGCGTGTQLALYDKPGCGLFGVDLSEAMLSEARRKLGGEADLRLEDAAHTSFADGTFDLITAVLVLHEMPAEMRPAVLRECRRVVKADGRVMLMDHHFGPHPFPAGWAWKALLTLMEASAGPAHYANYRDFTKRGGLEALIAGDRFALAKRFTFKSGVAAVYLLEPRGTAG